MSLREALEFISYEYETAKAQPLKGNSVAQYIRATAAEEVQRVLGDSNRDLRVEGSSGKGVWAAVPWIAVFDPVVTAGRWAVLGTTSIVWHAKPHL
jgi:hypothetical protein